MQFYTLCTNTKDKGMCAWFRQTEIANSTSDCRNEKPLLQQGTPTTQQEETLISSLPSFDTKQNPNHADSHM